MNIDRLYSKINNMGNQIPYEFHRKKMLLNEDFKNNANITGLVSYIYYPSQKEHPFFGHGELEIEGDSYTLMNDINRKVRPLSKMIRTSLSGAGFPFFRFNISITPHQLCEIREKAPTTDGILCSMSALKPLSQYVNFKVPLPLTISPLTSAIYLISAKKFGSRRICRIEFYGEENSLKNLSKSITGVAVEFFLISVFAIYSISSICKLMSSFN